MVLHELSAVQVLQGLEEKNFSSLELVDALLARIEEFSDINAFRYIDCDKVRDAAAEADNVRARGQASALTGLPISFKDNIAVEGQFCGAGTPGLAAYSPKQDAEIVRVLRDAGAICFGRNGMHELAIGATSNNGAYGAVHNPHAHGHVPGGSSGGTGAAVAARLVPVAIGTDTGGSVRVPAALCGVYGFRPTTGRWSTKGVVPLSSTRDTPGPIARSIADIALLDRIITGNSQPIRNQAIAGLRIGIPKYGLWSPVSTEVGEACQKGLDMLTSAGAQLVEIDTREIIDLNDKIGMTIAMYETAHELHDFLDAMPQPISFDDLVAQIASSEIRALVSRQGRGNVEVQRIEYRAAIDEGRPKMRQLYSEFFQSKSVDFVAYPTVPVPAPRIGEDDSIAAFGGRQPTFKTLIRNTDPAACVGLPGLTMNCGVTPDGLPIGLAFDADFGADQRLLALGSALEAHFPPAPLTNVTHRH